MIPFVFHVYDDDTPNVTVTDTVINFSTNSILKEFVDFLVSADDMGHVKSKIIRKILADVDVRGIGGSEFISEGIHRYDEFMTIMKENLHHEGELDESKLYDHSIYFEGTWSKPWTMIELVESYVVPAKKLIG